MSTADVLNAASVEPTPIESPAGSDRQLFDGDSDEKAAPSTTTVAGASQARPSRWKLWAAIGSAIVIVLALAIVLPLYFTVIKKKQPSSGGSGSGGSSSGNGDLPVTQPVSIVFYHFLIVFGFI